MVETTGDKVEKLPMPSSVGLYNHPWQLALRERDKTTSVGSKQKVKLPCRTIPYSPNQRFFGRKDVLRSLSSAIFKDAGGQNSVALHGLGGIGKTQIVLRFAWDNIDNFPVILWIDASSHEKIQKSFVEAAKRLRLIAGNSPINPDTIVADCKDWLARTSEPWLMIFDNAIDLSILDLFWPPANHGAIILTSRDPASKIFASENIFVKAMNDEEAMSMLVALVRDEVKGMKAFEYEEDAHTIVKMLGNLPLGIQQASDYIKENWCSLAEFIDIMQEYDPAKGAFENIDVSFPLWSYNDWLSTVWKPSLESASDSAVALFRLCAFLSPDGIPETLIEDGLTKAEQSSSVLQKSTYEASLESLLRKGLLQMASLSTTEETEEDPKVFKALFMHRLVQQVSFHFCDKDQLLESKEQAGGVLGVTFPQLSSSQWQLTDQWHQCSMAISHVIAFQEKCAKYHLELPQGFEVTLFNAGWYLLERKDTAQGFQLLFAAERLCDERKIDSDIKYRIYTGIGTLHCDSGKVDYEEAEKYFRKVYNFRQATCEADDPAMAHAVDDLANSLTGLGRHDEGIKLHEDAYAVIEKLEDRAKKNDICSTSTIRQRRPWR